MGDLGKELPAAAKEASPGRHTCTCAGVCEHTRVYLQISSQRVHRLAALSQQAMPRLSQEPRLQALCPSSGQRVLAPASSALIQFWGELSMELTGDPGEHHFVTDVPASQSIPRREAPLKRCGASPGTSPSSRRGSQPGFSSRQRGLRPGSLLPPPGHLCS